MEIIKKVEEVSIPRKVYYSPKVMEVIKKAEESYTPKVSKTFGVFGETFGV
jgi:hypothetical protein